MEYSVVIPLFDEAESLQILQEDLHSVMADLGGEYEIIYVNDGSKDHSLDILNSLKDQYGEIRIISFEQNRGQSAALFAGFKAASGKWIITLDADWQNPPQEIYQLLEFKDDFDFVAGVRVKRKDTWWRKFSSHLARFFRWVVLKDQTQDIGCSLKLFKREVIGDMIFFKNFHRFFTFMARISGFSVKEVYVNHNIRKFGKSKYTTLDRLGEGIFDLWGVFWLKRRLLTETYTFSMQNRRKSM
jgi:glycosyltransferase involved in cell wall biosynthesis